MIKRLLQFATRFPVIWGLLFTFGGIVLSSIALVLSFPLSKLFPAGDWGRPLAEAICRTILALFCILILWQLGWLKPVGLMQLHNKRWWLYLPLFALYIAIVALYSYTGNLQFTVTNKKLGIAIMLNMLSVGLIEELVFRGLVMYGFVRVWGKSTWGLAGSVLISALFFGSAHLLNLMAGKAVPQTLLQCLGSFVSGIYYGAFVLSSGSLWPAIFLHGLLNVVVNVKIADQPAYQEPVSASITMLVLTCPIVIYAVWLLWKMPLRAVVPHSP